MESHVSREELARRIAEVALLRGQFTLRSGKVSNYYLDKYMFATRPEILRALAALIDDRVPDRATLLAGAELGGIPLAVAASLATDLPCIFIRQARKDYGTSRRVEGALSPTDAVVLLEDVATTGGQVLEAARVIEEVGAEVIGVIATIDRLEGARENVESAGYEFDALFTSADLGIEPGT